MLCSMELKDSGRRITNSVKRLEGGLAKLCEAADAVDEMQTELSAKKIVVDEKTAAVEVRFFVISLAAHAFRATEFVRVSLENLCRCIRFLVATPRKTSPSVTRLDRFVHVCM